MKRESKGKWSAPRLTESEELLLCRYFDQECGKIASFRAGRLLRRNCEARQFLESLENVGAQVTAHCHEAFEQSGAGADLWQRISARIEAEEHAAIYLGNRSHVPERESLLSRVKMTQALVGGFSGAAVTAFALLMMVGPQEESKLPTIARGDLGTGSSGAFTQVSLDNGTATRHAQSSRISPRSRSSMEVDWMRANGSLKFIQNPEGKSAIIWVRRRGTNDSNTKRLQPTPIVGATIQNDPNQVIPYSPH